MSTSDEKDQKSKTTKGPEQKLGDTPVPPWEMPTPEEKAQAKPIRRALREAVARVDTPEKADKVIEKLETSAADKTAKEVEETQEPTTTTAAAAHQVEKAAQTAHGEKRRKKYWMRLPMHWPRPISINGKWHQRPCRRFLIQNNKARLPQWRILSNV